MAFFHSWKNNQIATSMNASGNNQMATSMNGDNQMATSMNGDLYVQQLICDENAACTITWK